MIGMARAFLLVLALFSGTVWAAPTFQAAGTAQSGTGAVSPAWPAHAVGDVALLFVESTGGEPVTLSTPAGFVEVTSSPQATGTGTNGTQLTVFWARATSAAMPAPTVADPGNHVYARILTYRGVVGSGNPWNVTGGGVKATASTSLTVTSVTTTVADTLIVQAAAHDRDNTGQHFSNQTNANLTGITERTDAGTTSGNGGGIAVWDGVMATAGATGSTMADLSNSVVNAFLTIALYFPPRACVSVVSGNWSNANTWNCGVGPGDGPPTANDSVTINGQTVSLDTSASAASLTINSGTLQQTGAVVRSLSISGNMTNSGTVADNGASGSFDLTVGGNLTVNGTSFTVDNLTVAGNTTIGATFTVRADFNVGGDLTNNSAPFTVANLNFQRAGTQAATFYGTQNFVTNLTVDAGSTVSSSNYSSINLRGNLSNNGAINLPNTSWLINGTVAQSIGGAVDTSLGNLTMNNAAGLTLNRNVSVPGTLTLTSGLITTGAFTLTAGANCPGAISGGGAASYVNGNLRLTYPSWNVTCVYPVGTATTYAPITVTIPWFSGITGGTLTGSTANGEHPQIASSGLDPAQDVNRYWMLGVAGDTMSTLPAAGSYTATFNFVAGDVDSGATVSTFRVGLRSGGSWSAPAGSASGTSATFPGQTTFGSYAVGAVLPPVVTLGKSAGSAAAAVNSYVTYLLTASNTTSTALSNVVLTDVIPASMVYTTHAATLGSANVAGQTLTWTIPYIPAGGSAQLTLVVQPTVRGSFTNTVTSPGATPASADILILPYAITRYNMDEDVGTWNGTAGEVIDSGGNGLSGRRRTTTTPTTTNTIDPTPTIASQHPAVIGGFCNSGDFDGRAVVESASSPYFQFSNQLSASAWIYPTAYPTSDLYSILSNDVNYEFHLNTTGHLYWWWQASTLTSAAVIPLNTWTHIAITFDSTAANRRQRIYINGVLDANTNNWQGTLATNNCPFYIGGDISTGSGCALLPGRNFRGRIDEAKIYDYELTAAEVQADMNLGRLCGTSSFDHIRIEHDGSATTCAPKTVTVKACMDSSCSSLYPGTVTVRLTPTGWTPGDILTINGGVATATLSNTAYSEPSVTLGTSSIAPAAANPTRCFDGATETCTLSVAATDCSFDATEVGANPRTHLYTKLAGTAFNVDVLAVGVPPTTVDTTKNSTVSVDLVNTTSAACSGTSTALNTAQSVTLVSGRRTVSLSSATVVPSAQVRIRSGASAPYSYSCSFDKFAIRPSAVTLTSTNALATPPSPTDANTIVAGTAFNISATTAPVGYTGVLALTSAALTAQLPTDVSAVTNGGAVGTVTLGSSLQANTAQGGNATYSEVGYLYANAGAFRDTSYTGVDQINQVANCATTDTCDCLLSSSTTNPGVPNNLSDVLINGRYGCYVGNKARFGFGRFIPDHFDTAVNTVTGVPMACPAGMVCPCPSGSVCPPNPSTGFVYSGQGFTVQVAARNAASGTTQNYTSNFAKAVTLGAWDAPGSTTTQNPSGALTNTAIAAAAFGAGVATTAQPVYTLAAVPTAPTDIYLRATESAADGVTSRRAAAPANSVEGGVKVLSGRFKVSSAYGSETLPLRIVATVQYWDGASWLTSATDSVSSFNTATNLTRAIISGDLNAGNLNVVGAGPVTFINGVQAFSLAAPGVAGSADIGLNAPAYLLPGGIPGRVTFGVYKNPNNYIYRREN